MTVLMREVIGDVLRRARIDQAAHCAKCPIRRAREPGLPSEVERGRREPSSELLGSICGALDIPLSRVLIDAGEQTGPCRTARRPEAGRGHRQHRHEHQGRHPAGHRDGGRLKSQSAGPDRAVHPEAAR